MLQRKRVCQRCQHCDAMVGDDICATYEYVFVFSPLLLPFSRHLLLILSVFAERENRGADVT